MAEVMEVRQQQLEEKITEIKREQLENNWKKRIDLKEIEEENQKAVREEKKKLD